MLRSFFVFPIEDNALTLALYLPFASCPGFRSKNTAPLCFFGNENSLTFRLIQLAPAACREYLLSISALFTTNIGIVLASFSQIL